MLCVLCVLCVLCILCVFADSVLCVCAALANISASQGREDAKRKNAGAKREIEPLAALVAMQRKLELFEKEFQRQQKELKALKVCVLLCAAVCCVCCVCLTACYWQEKEKETLGKAAPGGRASVKGDIKTKKNPKGTKSRIEDRPIHKM